MATDAAASMLFHQLLESFMTHSYSQHFRRSPPPDPVFDPVGHAAYVKQLNEDKRREAEMVARGYLQALPDDLSEEEALAPVPTGIPLLPLYALTPRQASDHDRQKDLYLAHKARQLRVELQKYDDDVVGRKEALIKFGDSMLSSLFGSDWAESAKQQFSAKATPSDIYDQGGYDPWYAAGSNPTGTCPHHGAASSLAAAHPSKATQQDMFKHGFGGQSKTGPGANTAKGIPKKTAAGVEPKNSSDAEMRVLDGIDYDVEDVDAVRAEEIYASMLREGGYLQDGSTDWYNRDDMSDLYDPYDDPYDDDYYDPYDDPYFDPYDDPYYDPYDYPSYNLGLDPDYDPDDDPFGIPEYRHYGYLENYGLDNEWNFDDDGNFIGDGHPVTQAVLKSLYLMKQGDDSLHTSYGRVGPNPASKKVDKGKAKKAKKKKAKKAKKGGAASGPSQGGPAGFGTKNGGTGDGGMIQATGASVSVRAGEASASSTALGASGAATSSKTTVAQPSTSVDPRASLMKSASAVEVHTRQLSQALPAGWPAKSHATSVASVGLGLASSSPPSVGHRSLPLVTAQGIAGKTANFGQASRGPDNKASSVKTPAKDMGKPSATFLNGQSRDPKQKPESSADVKGEGKVEPAVPTAPSSQQNPQQFNLGKRKKEGTGSSTDSATANPTIKVHLPSAGSSSKPDSKPAKKKPSSTPTGSNSAHNLTSNSGAQKPKANVKLPPPAPGQGHGKAHKPSPGKPAATGSTASAAAAKSKGIKLEVVVWKKGYTPSKRPGRDCWHSRGPV